MPEEPVTLDQLEELLLRLTGNSIEALEQQMLSRLKEQTFVGGKRVTRQELPELPKDAVTTVHRVKVSLYGAKPPVWVFNEQFADLGDLFNVGDLNERLADLATVLIPAR